MIASDQGKRPGATAGRQVEFPEVDCLRGIAMAIVFSIHAQGIVLWMKPVPPELSLLQAFVWGGHTAPTLFFVLSAFLLSRPFLAEARGGRHVSLSNYFLRRALRILPLYAVAVFVAALVCAERPADVLRGVPYLLFLNSVPGWTTDLPNFSGPWWTVATEVQFYLLLPLLLLLRSRPGRVVGASLLSLYAAVYAAFFFGWLRLDDLSQFVLAHSVVGRGPAFAAGILAAVAYDRWGDRLRAWSHGLGWRGRLGGDLLLVASFLSLALLLRRVVLAGSYVDVEIAWPVWRILEAGLWATVLLLLVTAPMSLKPLVANRAWAALGIVSYSVYLAHVPVLLHSRKVVNAWLPGVLGAWTPGSAAVVAALATIVAAIASFTYATIERPAMRWKIRVPLWSERHQAVLGDTAARRVA